MKRAWVAVVFALLGVEATAQGSPPLSPPIRLAMIEAFSGPFANTGDAVARNLLFAIERINARGGVKLAGGARTLQLETFDSKGQVEEALTMLRRARTRGSPKWRRSRAGCAPESLAFFQRGGFVSGRSRFIPSVTSH